MKLDYGTQLSPDPIQLSIGTLIKPTLKRISNITFEKFDYYKVLLKLTPEFYYTYIKNAEDGKEYWESLSESDRENIGIFDLIVNDDLLIKSYLEILNFFFIEDVVFVDGFFIWIKPGLNKNNDELTKDDVVGIIDGAHFKDVLYIIQQVCCIDDKEENIDELKFKNEAAKKLYMRMQKSQKESKLSKKEIAEYSLPNIISAVSNKHPTVSPINVWDLTVFQLLDSFNRTRVNSVYEISRTTVSVWGDEKKTFDSALWYKNEFDKK